MGKALHNRMQKIVLFFQKHKKELKKMKYFYYERSGDNCQKTNPGCPRFS